MDGFVGDPTMGTQNLHFRGYNPYIGGLKPSFFHGFGVQGKGPSIRITYRSSHDFDAMRFPRPSESEVRRMIDEVDADGCGTSDPRGGGTVGNG